MINIQKLLFILFLIIYFSIQIYLLNSDPKFFISFGRLIDQGYWLHPVKNFHFNNTFITDEFNFSLFTAPLFVVFSTFISFFSKNILLSGQILSLISLILSTCFIYIFFKNRLKNQSIYFICFIFLINYLNWQYGRLALSELFSSVFLIPSFLLLQNKDKISFILSGLFFSFSVLSKSTNIQIMPSYIFIFLFLFFNKIKLKNITLFIISFVIPILIFLTIIYYTYNFNQLITIYQESSRLFYPKNIKEGIRLLLEFPQRSFWTQIHNFPLIFIPTIYFLQTVITSIQKRKIVFNKLEFILYSWILGSSIMYTVSHFQPESRMISAIFPLSILNIILPNKISTDQIYSFFNKNKFIKFFFQIPLNLVLVEIISILVDIRFQNLSTKYFKLILLILVSIIHSTTSSKYEDKNYNKVILSSLFSSALVISCITSFILVSKWLTDKYLYINADYLIRKPIGILIFFILMLIFLIMQKNNKHLRSTFHIFLFFYILINLSFLINESFTKKTSIFNASQKINSYLDDSKSTISGAGASLLVINRPNKVVQYFDKNDIFYGCQSDLLENFHNVDYYLNPPGVSIPEFIAKNYKLIDNFQLLENTLRDQRVAILDLYKKN